MSYFLILIWLCVCACVADYLKLKRPELVCGIKEERYSWLFAFIVFLPIIIMAGTRGDIGDTWSYRITFLKSIPDTFLELLGYVSSVSKDKGFSLFSGFIKLIIGNHVDLYFCILAIIQGSILVLILRKYSSSYILSVFLFVASTDYLSWMYNGIRQFTAVVIIFAATSLLLKRKYLPLIAVILLASTMHQSALIMIPIIFIVQGKAWNKKTLLFILATLLAIFFVGSFTSFMDDALAETQYKNVVSDFTEWEDDGTNPLRVLVYSIPAIISFFGRKKIQNSNNNLINICTNMSIISAGLYLVSMFTSGILIGRLPIYCSLYSYILLPWEIENIFNQKLKPYIYISMVTLYIVYYVYQTHFGWGLY